VIKIEFHSGHWQVVLLVAMVKASIEGVDGDKLIFFQPLRGVELI